MKSARSIICAFFLFFCLSIHAQDGLDVKYILPQSMWENIFIIRDTMIVDTVGRIRDVDDPSMPTLFKRNHHNIYREADLKRLRELNVNSIWERTIAPPKQLFCTITDRTGDTLFITFWHSSDLDLLYPNLADSDFALIIGDINIDSIYKANKWITKRELKPFYPVAYRGIPHKPKWYSVPFNHQYLGATTLPFRIKMQDGQVDKDFLNANVNYGWLWGRTKFYKYEDMKPTNTSGGFGVYGGLVQIHDATKNKDLIGVSLGLNAIYNVYNSLSFILSVGTNIPWPGDKDIHYIDGNINGWAIFQGYVGLGAGYKLYDIYQIGVNNYKQKGGS